MVSADNENMMAGTRQTSVDICLAQGVDERRLANVGHASHQQPKTRVLVCTGSRRIETGDKGDKGIEEQQHLFHQCRVVHNVKDGIKRL